MKITLRRARSEDAGDIYALEQECFVKPWSLESVTQGLQNPCSRFFMAEKGKTPIGYAGMLVAADEGYILNIAVAEKYRRLGVGKLLVRALTGQAMEEKLSFLTLEMRESNLAAAALYSGCGFSQAGLRRGYYQKPDEDAVLMTLHFNNSR